jgi:hypothetical protein
MRIKLLPAVILLASVLMAGPEVHSQKARQKCGFISEVSGKAVLQRGRKFYLVSGMEGVYCGELIKVFAGSRVVIATCASNTRSEVPGPAEFTVTAQTLVFKTGKPRNSSAINPDLCPFFMEQTFTNLARPEVDANGDFPGGIGEMTGSAIGMGPGSRFYGYLTDIKGDVFFTDEPVQKVTGDVAPGEERVLVTQGSELSIHSCGEGKKYQVKGPALIQLRDEDGKKPVTFLRGKAWKVEDIDGHECWVNKEAIWKSDDDHTHRVGLDGKEME